MASRPKTKSTTGVPALHSRPSTPVLSEVLEVVQNHVACLPRRMGRARISEYGRDGEPTDPGHTPEIEIRDFTGFKSIAELDLGASAKAAAEELLRQFPADVKFTSGKRNISEQADAMALNIFKNRKYVEQTYKDTPQRAALQKWIDDHPAATSAAAIAAGLEGVMQSWTKAQKRNFSRHITGDAFDVYPMDGEQGEKIRQAIAKLPKLNWHTFNEAGLDIWHAQFDV